MTTCIHFHMPFHFAFFMHHTLLLAFPPPFAFPHNVHILVLDFLWSYVCLYTAVVQDKHSMSKIAKKGEK